MRSCGVLLHITSLPSPYGIGTFGREAEKFVDWLKSAGQTYWQILPLGPTGYGDSPYQSFSVNAGNPLLIDIDDLVESGLITRQECLNADFGADPSIVDYDKVYKTKMQLLKNAHKSFNEESGYISFIRENFDWLDDYALFMAIKGKFDQKSWTTWDIDLKKRNNEVLLKYKEELFEEINFWKFVQYIFYQQWNRLKKYCNKNGIQIIGDIPIYVAMDSADVWANPKQFLLDENFLPTKVAGVPPDYFSKTGQLWGNPLYNWTYMSDQGYDWWIKRMRTACFMYDVVRIDHFRAFDTYYSIPFGHETAENGKWEEGPGIEFFKIMKKELGEINIIAEDLGEVFESVKELLEDTGFPGMKVMQFGFNAEFSDNPHLPHQYADNYVVYTGTHDNETLMQWLKNNAGGKKMAKKYLNYNFFEKLNWTFIRSAYASVAKIAVIPMQDILGLGEKSRMNVPSTIGGNWIWRMTPQENTDKIAKKLNKLAKTYYR